TDAALTVRTRLRPGAEPLTVSAFATKAFFQYRLPGRDTLAVASRRAGGRLAQDLTAGAHRLRLAAEAWRDWTVGGTTGLPDTLGLGRTRLQLLLRDELRAGPLALTAEARLHEGARAGGHLGAALDARPVRLFAEAERAAGAPPAWVEQHGFGPFLDGLPGAARERTLAGRAGLTLRAGAFDATAFGFAHHIDDAVDLYETGEDTAAVRVLPSALRRAGAAADLGWRRDARRGLYLVAQPTLTTLLDAGASDLHARQDAALPAFFADGRLGARYLLFNGDLDLDVSVRGRFWTAMRSRTLHPATGLLALPALGARSVPASGTLDLVGLGRVRTATLFIAYENVLSGTTFLAGNYLVPVYPLPERRLRFGVFWPIPN
ncbi:MAG: hypothetical protein R3362_08940, partial [Rhodothermales bacterium]|nr:hypothetical protein [Rhodothermales bacterium]